MAGRIISPTPTEGDPLSYLKALKEAFHDDPTKYEEFIKFLRDHRNHRVDRDSAIAGIEELVKDHQDLVLGFKSFLPPEAKSIMHPEAKKAEQLAESSDTKMKHAEAEDFMNKLKTRFRSFSTHVVGSFRGIMKMFKEGKMSVKEVHKEVTDVLYYHEDLIEDFHRLFKENDPVESASLLLHL